jgi:CheY-like chemotaxis protein/HPt (histidine-containing phosphotransfer) domain-containing protein
MGYEVTAVSNGLEAVDTLAAPDALPFDLVLMDCQMPRLDGYEATARIRRLPGPAARTPIVALTAHAVQEELDRCLASGMDDYLTKPVREEALRRKLERWLGDGGKTPGEEQAQEPAPAASLAPDPGPDETLDMTQIDSLRELGRESGPELVRGILAQFASRPYLDELRDALERGDREALHCRAHGLKGSSAFLGARHLSDLFARLEQMAHQGTREECLEQLALIEAERGRVLPLLAAALEIDAVRGE